jgi:hypothetical protein
MNKTDMAGYLRGQPFPGKNDVPGEARLPPRFLLDSTFFFFYTPSINEQFFIKFFWNQRPVL